jgi:hypothetical protein
MKLACALIISLCTTTVATAQTNALNSSGNVGVGITSPWTSLHIQGPFTPGTAQLLVQSSGADDRQGIGFYNAAGQRTGIIYTGPAAGGDFILGREQAGQFRFFSNGHERLTIGTGGNVGIGTSSPNHRLHVIAPEGSNGMMIETPNEGPWAFRLRNTSAPNRGLEIFQDDSGTSQIWSNYNGGSGALIAMHPSGNLGIGTSSPDSKLAISGAGETAFHVNSNGSSPVIRLKKDGISKWGFLGEFPSAGSLSFYNYFLNDHVMVIRDTGNVGIGTAAPTHKLAVNGTIKAKEVIVETTGWSDYVFADDYALQPLSKVEAHIKTNKHLPGIPSAAQIAEQGVSIGDMQARLLAKIEELTLHQIAQEKLLKAQSDELAALRTEVRTLRNQ